MNKEKISENVIDDKMSIATFDKDELKEIFNFKSDKSCLSFKREENQISSIPDKSNIDANILKYISFVKVI